MSPSWRPSEPRRLARDDRSGHCATARSPPHADSKDGTCLLPPNQPHPLRQLLSSLWTTERGAAVRCRSKHGTFAAAEPKTPPLPSALEPPPAPPTFPTPCSRLRRSSARLSPPRPILARRQQQRGRGAPTDAASSKPSADAAEAAVSCARRSTPRPPPSRSRCPPAPRRPHVERRAVQPVGGRVRRRRRASRRRRSPPPVAPAGMVWRNISSSALSELRRREASRAAEERARGDPRRRAAAPHAHGRRARRGGAALEHDTDAAVPMCAREHRARGRRARRRAPASAATSARRCVHTSRRSCGSSSCQTRASWRC